jgi:hypothetical protein
MQTSAPITPVTSAAAAVASGAQLGARSVAVPFGWRAMIVD